MNWGNKILLAFAAFFIVIGILVYKSFHTKSELVSSEYYKDELEYQKVINGSRNLKNASEPIKINQSNRKFNVIFPSEKSLEKITGTVWLYCAYDSKKDMRFALKLDSKGEILFDSSSLSSGQYTLKVNLDDEGMSYFIEKEISILP